MIVAFIVNVYSILIVFEIYVYCFLILHICIFLFLCLLLERWLYYHREYTKKKRCICIKKFQKNNKIILVFFIKKSILYILSVIFLKVLIILVLNISCYFYICISTGNYIIHKKKYAQYICKSIYWFSVCVLHAFIDWKRWFFIIYHMFLIILIILLSNVKSIYIF